MIVLSYLLIAILTFYVAVGTSLLSIFRFSIMMNQVLGGFFSGFAIGLFVRLRKGNVKA
jgi:hypothetical protein